jgi:hypothetical protein
MRTLLWDLGGNAPIDWRVGHYKESETGHLLNMLGAFRDGDLLIADRLYGNVKIFTALLENRTDFVIRVKCSEKSLGIIRDFCLSNEDDALCTLPDDASKQIRLIRSPHSQDDDPTIIITSLTDEQAYPLEAITDLYHRRWGIETAYREGKTWLALKELPGHNKEQIRHEVAAMMIFWLLQAELEAQARAVYAEEITQQQEKDPAKRPAEQISEIPVRFNRKLTALAAATILRSAIRGLDEAREAWRVNLDYIWRNRARRRPGRKYRRTSERPHELKKRDEIAKAKAKGGRAKS